MEKPDFVRCLKKFYDIEKWWLRICSYALSALLCMKPFYITILRKLLVWFFLKRKLKRNWYESQQLTINMEKSVFLCCLKKSLYYFKIVINLFISTFYSCMHEGLLNFIRFWENCFRFSSTALKIKFFEMKVKKNM